MDSVIFWIYYRNILLIIFDNATSGRDSNLELQNVQESAVESELSESDIEEALEGIHAKGK